MIIDVSFILYRYIVFCIHGSFLVYICRMNQILILLQFLRDKRDHENKTVLMTMKIQLLIKQPNQNQLLINLKRFD